MIHQDVHLIARLLLMYLGVPFYGLEKDESLRVSGTLDRLFRRLNALKKVADPSQDVAELLCAVLDADEYKMIRSVVVEISVAANAKSLEIHTQSSVPEVCQLISKLYKRHC